MHVGWKQKLAAAGAATAVVASGAATLGTGIADAAPPRATKVPVWHVPSVGITVSGLLIPTPWLATVYASSDQRGTVTFSVAGGGLCSTNAAYKPVDIHWANLSNGRSGATSVQPCSFGDPTYPGLFKKAHTGSGQVVLALVVPGAIPATIPGYGTLSAP
ncbi:hypothetical protein GII30_11070 [Gordonia amarae]|uniref:Uncharacterized protein n=3 Tax=Gordonia amarae TaxID=36821 RepID=G7GLC1_9ACTN|nr:hypothetical protein [Gordonia amarae]QHN30886.1 hypothetical protein GII32_11235 [Gordonia amarae]QHN39632.1 hypothetical protein GII30_11070 [Gordonia amarae]GAB04396.1 hypothetical protein GOAMR_19_00830 [Gordonia amarae NBRC 15530]